MDEEQNKTQNENHDESDEVLLDIEDEEPIDPLAEEQKKSNELLDRLQRLQAEFDNYRKRMDNHSLEVRKFASEEILLKILDVYDNFLRALDMDFETDPTSAKAGIKAIQQQFEKMLTLEGVRPIESIGKMFDPYYHHAVNRADNPDYPDSVIIDEYQRGYMFKEKVLRPAIVCVNLHGSQSAIEEDDNENQTKSVENGE